MSEFHELPEGAIVEGDNLVYERYSDSSRTDDYYEEGDDIEEDEEDLDLENYKGIYFNDDPGRKFQDEVNGAHFEYNDMCGRLGKLR